MWSASPKLVSATYRPLSMLDFLSSSFSRLGFPLLSTLSQGCHNTTLSITPRRAAPWRAPKLRASSLAFPLLQANKCLCWIEVAIKAEFPCKFLVFQRFDGTLRRINRCCLHGKRTRYWLSRHDFANAALALRSLSQCLRLTLLFLLLVIRVAIYSESITQFLSSLLLLLLLDSFILF